MARRAACGTRRARFRNKRNRSGTCCTWVRKRCEEPTESPRSPETVRARRNTCRAYVAAGGAPTQVISVGRSHGAYRCARKAASGGVAYTRTHFHSYLLAELARCATRAASLRISWRLAEFATQRPDLNKKNRSERRFCARTGDFVETWSGR